jgi:hypothetical protein
LTVGQRHRGRHEGADEGAGEGPAGNIRDHPVSLDVPGSNPRRHNLPSSKLLQSLADKGTACSVCQSVQLSVGRVIGSLLCLLVCLPLCLFIHIYVCASVYLSFC